MKIPPPPLFIRDAAGSAAPGPAVPGPEIRQKSGGFLNQTTLIIILLIFAGYVVFQGIKSFQLRSMNTALRAKDSETLEKNRGHGHDPQASGRLRLRSVQAERLLCGQGDG